MPDLRISEIMSMQNELQEKYKGKWMHLTPDNGRSSLLWLIEEMGEVIAIIKKRGEKDIMNDSEVRQAFVEEMIDVIMYYTDALACYGITPEEFSETFIKKHVKNMGRDFVTEHKEFLQNK